MLKFDEFHSLVHPILRTEELSRNLWDVLAKFGLLDSMVKLQDASSKFKEVLSKHHSSFPTTAVDVDLGPVLGMLQSSKFDGGLYFGDCTCSYKCTNLQQHDRPHLCTEACFIPCQPGAKPDCPLMQPWLTRCFIVIQHYSATLVKNSRSEYKLHLLFDLRDVVIISYIKPTKDVNRRFVLSTLLLDCRSEPEHESQLLSYLRDDEEFSQLFTTDVCANKASNIPPCVKCHSQLSNHFHISKDYLSHFDSTSTGADENSGAYFILCKQGLKLYKSGKDRQFVVLCLYISWNEATQIREVVSEPFMTDRLSKCRIQLRYLVLQDAAIYCFPLLQLGGMYMINNGTGSTSKAQVVYMKHCDVCVIPMSSTITQYLYTSAQELNWQAPISISYDMAQPGSVPENRMLSLTRQVIGCEEISNSKIWHLKDKSGRCKTTFRLLVGVPPPWFLRPSYIIRIDYIPYTTGHLSISSTTRFTLISLISVPVKSRKPQKAISCEVSCRKSVSIIDLITEQALATPPWTLLVSVTRVLRLCVRAICSKCGVELNIGSCMREQCASEMSSIKASAIVWVDDGTGRVNLHVLGEFMVSSLLGLTPELWQQHIVSRVHRNGPIKYTCRQKPEELEDAFLVSVARLVSSSSVLRTLLVSAKIKRETENFVQQARYADQCSLMCEKLEEPNYAAEAYKCLASSRTRI